MIPSTPGGKKASTDERINIPIEPIDHRLRRKHVENTFITSCTCIGTSVQFVAAVVVAVLVFFVNFITVSLYNRYDFRCYVVINIIFVVHSRKRVYDVVVKSVTFDVVKIRYIKSSLVFRTTCIEG